ncbi:MAG: carbon-nitrogen hydrolase family protein [Chitinophagales bacterium]
MKIAAAQYPITCHSALYDWKLHTENWIRTAAEQGAQLLLFPEYGAMELVSIFPTEIQQDLHQQILELQNIYNDVCTFFENMAIKYGVIIVAPSFPVKQDDQIYNRVNVFSTKGHCGYQDKFFMTRFEDETWHIHSAPKVLTVFETDSIKFGIQICYDVEFAIGSKLLCDAGAELILAPSCTETIRGAARVHIGARARAMENQCYTVVSQTVGNAVWSPAVDINYGYAAVYATPDMNLPEEGIVMQGTPQQECWLYSELDMTKIKEVRRNGQVLNYHSHQSLQYIFKDEIIEMKTVKC